MALQPVTVTLSSPIKCMGKDVPELVITREANGADMRAIDGLGTKTSTLELIRRICRTTDDKQLTSKAVDELTWRDISAIEDALAPFVGIGPETTAPSADASQ